MFFSSEARPKAERSSELGWQEKKWTKKKGTTTTTTTRRRFDHQFCTWSNYSLSCRSFCLSLPLSTFQKLFFMFSTSIIYPKDILRKQFSQKSFLKKKKNQKKLFIFFFDFFFSNFFFDFFFRILFYPIFFDIVSNFAWNPNIVVPNFTI